MSRLNNNMKPINTVLLDKIEKPHGKILKQEKSMKAELHNRHFIL